MFWIEVNISQSVNYQLPVSSGGNYARPHTKSTLEADEDPLVGFFPVVLGMVAAVATLTLAAPDVWKIFEIPDSRYDTFGFTTPDHDITWFSAETDGNDLKITLVFSDTIAEPNGDPNYAVRGFIDLDTDQNQAS